jgi:hypothetical protein
MKVIKKEEKTETTPKKEEKVILEISKAVRIPDTNIILQAGDKIEVMKEMVDQTINASNDCASGSFSIYEDDEGNQYVSGNISISECMSGGKVTADVVKKVLDSVVSGLKLQAPEPVEVPEEEMGMV